MSDVKFLLARCHELGAQLSPNPDGTLRIKAPKPLPADLRSEVIRRKKEILTLFVNDRSVSIRPEYTHLYSDLASIIFEDLWSVDAEWLGNHHPQLWTRLRSLDDDLTVLQTRESESDYRAYAPSVGAYKLKELQGVWATPNLQALS